MEIPDDREQARGWVAIRPDFGDWEATGILSERRVRRWALVLDSRSIPCRIESGSAGWRLLVPSEYDMAAREQLRLFEEENRGWPPPEPPAQPLVDNRLTTLSVLVLLATFHNLTRLDLSLFGHRPVDWVGIGSARAGRILDGEVWRLVTALTLHSGWLHLLSNLTLGGLFIVWLCREVGSGAGWSLLLAAGILGNLTNSLAQPPAHSSVGASTLVFGAVGILASLNAVRSRLGGRKHPLLPIVAALALLALLGTEGKNTDLGAHLFGFLFGVILGSVAEHLLERRGRPGPGLNALLSLIAAVAVGAAWWAALRYGWK